MAYSKTNVVVVIFATVALVAGTLVVYSMGEVLHSQEEDPRELPHTYTVSGFINDLPCQGEGSSAYTPESKLYFTYTFNFKVIDELENAHTFTFGAIFNAEDNQPQADLYHYGGEEQVNDTTLSIWSHSENGYEYILYVGENCTVERVEINSPTVSLSGQLVE